MSLHPDIAAVLAGDSEGCIVCGDCLEIMADIPDGCVDAVVTDPPYGKRPMRPDGAKFGAPFTRSFDNTDDQWDSPITKAHIDCPRRASTNMIVWGWQYFPQFLSKTNCELVWDKETGKNFFADCETAWTTLTTTSKIFRYGWLGAHARQKEPAYHPTQKPVALMEWCLGFLPDAITILDPFCGSGTTCVAAKKLGRRWIGIDIDEGYCQTARNRLRDTERPLFAAEGAKHGND